MVGFETVPLIPFTRFFQSHIYVICATCSDQKKTDRKIPNGRRFGRESFHIGCTNHQFHPRNVSENPKWFLLFEICHVFLLVLIQIIDFSAMNSGSMSHPRASKQNMHSIESSFWITMKFTHLFFLNKWKKLCRAKGAFSNLFGSGCLSWNHWAIAARRRCQVAGGLRQGQVTTMVEKWLYGNHINLLAKFPLQQSFCSSWLSTYE